MGTVPSKLFTKLKSARRLPSPPGSALRVLELCRMEDPGIQELSLVITADPALAARILKFANSPATGLARKVTSVREAVLLMGVRSVKLAALGFCLATPETESACPGFDLRQYWSEACATAVIARCIAKEHFGAEPEEGFTVGLLAGIGRLAMAQGIPDTYTKILDHIGPDQPLVDAERAELGVSHAELGAELLEDWGLPEILVDAVRSIPESETASGDGARLAQIVALASRLTPWFVQHQVTSEQQASIRAAAELELKLDAGGWERLVERVRTGYQALADVLKLHLADGVTVLDLYAEAQEEAARVGMVAQMERLKTELDAQELRKKAATDSLTGIANRAKFDDRLAECVSLIRSNGSHFGLVLFDIDHFKSFNDAHGHQVGDLVLIRVARAVQNSMRETDLLARYGGEEFAIITPDSDRETVCLIAARARKTIELLVVQAADKRLSVTISAGVTLSSDFESLPTPDDLVAEADRQLYRSKSAGRNAWSYCDKTAVTPLPRASAA